MNPELAGTPADPSFPAQPAVGDPTAGGVPVTPGPTDLTRYDETPKDPAPVARHQQAGDVVTFEDYDYVTETTTTRHALIVAAGETVTVTRDGQDEDVPALTVVFLGEGVTLPADAFTI